MGYQEITTFDDLKKLISGDKLVVVEFIAYYIDPCKVITEDIEELSRIHPEAEYVTVDVDRVLEVSTNYIISEIPTVMFFKEDEKLGEVLDANITTIENKLKELLA